MLLVYLSNYAGISIISIGLNVCTPPSCNECGKWKHVYYGEQTGKQKMETENETFEGETQNENVITGNRK